MKKKTWTYVPQYLRLIPQLDQTRWMVRICPSAYTKIKVYKIKWIFCLKYEISEKIWHLQVKSIQPIFLFFQLNNKIMIHPRNLFSNIFSIKWPLTFNLHPLYVSLPFPLMLQIFFFGAYTFYMKQKLYVVN